MTRDRGGLAVVAAAAVPLLAITVGVGFLRFQVRRKLGVRGFRRALIRGGMPREQAARLAQSYHEASSVRMILQGAVASRRSSRPGRR